MNFKNGVTMHKTSSRLAVALASVAVGIMGAASGSQADRSTTLNTAPVQLEKSPFSGGVLMGRAIRSAR
jgi:hypothetical protein